MVAPTLSILTGSNTMGLVFQEQDQVTVRIWDANLPFTGSEGRLGLNLMGKTRIILIQGSHDGTGTSSGAGESGMQEWKNIIDSWINNDGIQSSITYTNSFNESRTVDGFDFEWTRSNKDPSRILYSLMMKQK